MSWVITMGEACSACSGDQTKEEAHTTPNIAHTRASGDSQTVQDSDQTVPTAILSLESDTEIDTEFESDYQSGPNPPNIVSPAETVFSPDFSGDPNEDKPELQFEDARVSMHEEHRPDLVRKHSSKKDIIRKKPKVHKHRSKSVHHKGLSDYDDSDRNNIVSSYREGILKGLTSLVIYLAEEHPALDLLDTVFDNGDTSLLMAVRYKEYEVIVYLLSQGSNV